MSTNTSIHGHDVIDIFVSAPHTRATLAAEVARRFGPDARFHTCSSADLTFDQLLGFLVDRKKLIESATGQLMFNQGEPCGH